MFHAVYTSSHPRVNLTVQEVVNALEAKGAIDVRVVDLKGKDTGMGDAMVFSTATTPLQMRRLADMLVYAVRGNSGSIGDEEARSWHPR